MSQQRRQLLEGTILDAVSADGVGNAFNVTDFQHIVMKFGTEGSADATIKFQGSIGSSEESEAPDFSSSQGVDNHWDYIGVYDYEDRSFIAGDTGISPSGSDDIRNLLVNVDGLDWINVEISNHSAGDITVELKAYNNS